MPKPLPEPIVTDVAKHEAALAWARFGWSGREPAAVTALKTHSKPGHKSVVYRLHAATSGGGNVIAKRCRRLTSQTERTVYENLLPRLDIPTLQFFGSVDEDDGLNSWLFIEDAGEERCRDEERPSQMQWLASIHVSAVAAAQQSDLASGDSDRYLRHLRAARERIVSALELTHFTADDRDVQIRTLALCDYLEQRWELLTPLVSRFPRTLVHGDLTSKNVRVRRSSTGLTFFALDWETAGVGVPAADLGSLVQDIDHTANLPMEAYLTRVAPEWGCSSEELDQLANIGVVYRMAASIDWASNSLRFPPGQKPVRYLSSFERRLLIALARLGWSY